MIIESISLQNFMGYKKPCRIEFKRRKVVGIVGNNEAGKSSILQAISYLLYGKTRAGREVDLIHDSGKGNLVVGGVVRLPDNQALEIERGRTRSNEPILTVAGFQGKKPELKEYIAEQVALPYDDFISLSYFQQGDIHQFMDGDKRAYFQRWTSSLRVWKEMEALAKDRVGIFESEALHTRDKLERAKSFVATSDHVKQEGQQLKKALKVAEKDADTTEKKVQDLRVKLASADRKQEIEEALGHTRRMIQGVKEDSRRAKLNALRIEEELQKLSEGVCPVLGTFCKDLEESSLTQRVLLDGRLQEIQKRLRGMESQKEDLLEQAGRFEEQIESLLPPKELSDDLALARSLHKKAKKELRLAQQRYADARSRWRGIQEAKERLADLEHEEQEHNEELRRWAFIRYMCGNGGIPALLLDQELDRVEEKCNWVLERLDYPKRVKFSGYKELASFEAICPYCGSAKWYKQECKTCGTPRPKKRKDEPLVTVLDGDKERPFALESGGAQVLQSFAVRLACSLFVSNMTGIPLRMVMLDEVFAMLDADNRRKLMALVVDKLSAEFGLRQQLVVSHHEDVVNLVDDLLVVSRERGGSVANWA